MAEIEIVQPIRVMVYSDDGEGLENVLLRYRPEDPFVAELHFGGDNSWHIDRTLLAGGLIQPTGVGDVHIAPFGRNLAIILNSDSGSALLLTLLGPVERFLAATYRAVPDGAERPDVDALIDQIRESS